jgi:hypothetical protein
MNATMAPSRPAGVEELRALTAELLRHDGWSREYLLAHQRERLLATLRHAVAASPYYREVLGAGATTPTSTCGRSPRFPRRRSSSASTRS